MKTIKTIKDFREFIDGKLIIPTVESSFRHGPAAEKTFLNAVMRPKVDVDASLQWCMWYPDTATGTAIRCARCLADSYLFLGNGTYYELKPLDDDSGYEIVY